MLEHDILRPDKSVIISGSIKIYKSEEAAWEEEAAIHLLG